MLFLLYKIPVAASPLRFYARAFKAFPCLPFRCLSHSCDGYAIPALVISRPGSSPPFPFRSKLFAASLFVSFSNHFIAVYAIPCPSDSARLLSLPFHIHTSRIVATPFQLRSSRRYSISTSLAFSRIKPVPFHFMFMPTRSSRFRLSSILALSDPVVASPFHFTSLHFILKRGQLA